MRPPMADLSIPLGDWRTPNALTRPVKTADISITSIMIPKKTIQRENSSLTTLDAYIKHNKTMKRT